MQSCMCRQIFRYSFPLPCAARNRAGRSEIGCVSGSDVLRFASLSLIILVGVPAALAPCGRNRAAEVVESSQTGGKG